jgi:hypothetical protein
MCYHGAQHVGLGAAELAAIVDHCVSLCFDFLLMRKAQWCESGLVALLCAANVRSLNLSADL